MSPAATLKALGSFQVASCQVRITVLAAPAYPLSQPDATSKNQYHAAFGDPWECTRVLEFIRAGGWLMAPIILCSLIAVGLIVERFMSLSHKKVVPGELGQQVIGWATRSRLDESHITALAEHSPLGRILAAGVRNRSRSREIIKEAVEDTGRHVVHDLERYLNTLGTIAGISPLLGLLGTVVGMIKVFAVITTQGVGDAQALASGISQALVTTAAGLIVAIPSFFFYRYFRGKVSRLVVDMEQQALTLIDVLDGQTGNR